MPTVPARHIDTEWIIWYHFMVLWFKVSYWDRCKVPQKWMLHRDSKLKPLQEARLEVTKLNKVRTSPCNLWGNLRISESSHGLRSYLPGLCSLGQRVKQLMLLREPLTSFVKENTAIFGVVVTIHRLVPVEADCCMFFWCREFQIGWGSVQSLNSYLW